MFHGMGSALIAAMVLSIPTICAQAESAKTGIRGTVSFAPAMPGAQRAGESGVAPLSGADIQLQDEQGRAIAREVTDANGQYQFNVAPGTYRIQVGLRGSRFPRCKRADAIVRLDQISRVDIDCDSGIR